MADKANKKMLETLSGKIDHLSETMEKLAMKFNTLVSLTNGKRKKVKKDPDAPKRAKSGYLFYCKEHRDEVSKETKDGTPIKSTDVIKILAKKWAELSEQEKKKYAEQGDKDKERYSTELKEYEKKKKN
jgi:hypothetical protein